MRALPLRQPLTSLWSHALTRELWTLSSAASTSTPTPGTRVLPGCPLTRPLPGFRKRLKASPAGRGQKPGNVGPPARLRRPKLRTCPGLPAATAEQSRPGALGLQRSPPSPSPFPSPLAFALRGALPPAGRTFPGYYCALELPARREGVCGLGRPLAGPRHGSIFPLSWPHHARRCPRARR